MEEEGVIRCICGYDHDDGFTIQCERCLVWQHAACVGIRKDKVPDEYFCELCHPRPLDYDLARDIQRRRQPKKHANGQGSSHQRRKSNSIASAINPPPSNDTSLPGYGSPPMAASSSKTRRTSHSSSSRGVLPNKSSLQADISAPATNAIPATSGSLFQNAPNATNANQSNHHQQQQQHQPDEEVHSEDDELLAAADDYIPVAKLIVRDEGLQSLLKSISQDYPSAATSRVPLLTVSEKSELSGPRHIRLMVKPVGETRSSSKLGLFVDADCTSGQILAEVRGELMAKADYLSDLHASVDQAFGESALSGKEADLPLTDRYVFLHPEVGLVVDARRFGNESRFCRFSCHPNATLSSVRVKTKTEDGTSEEKAKNAIHLCLYSTAHINAGEEITIAFPVEFAHHEKLALECACGDYEHCAFNIRPKATQALSVLEENTIQSNEERRDSDMMEEEMNETRHGALRLKDAPLSASDLRSEMNPFSDDLSEYPSPTNSTIGHTASHDRARPTEKPYHLLSREERKIRDELARFARMEKDSERRRRSGGNKGNLKDEPLHEPVSASNDEDSSFENSSSSEKRDRFGVQSSPDGMRLSRLSSHHTSPLASSPQQWMPESTSPPRNMKRYWAAQYLAYCARQSPSLTVLVGKTVEGKDPAPLSDHEKRSEEATDIPDVVTCLPAESIANASAPLVSLKRSAPEEEVASAVNDQMADQEPPPTATRISLKDYRKKRKVLEAPVTVPDSLTVDTSFGRNLSVLSAGTDKDFTPSASSDLAANTPVKVEGRDQIETPR